MTFSTASRRLVTLVASISLAALLAACASQAEKDAATPVEKLYAEAMDDAESANYDRAIKSLDRIEGSDKSIVHRIMFDSASNAA